MAQSSSGISRCLVVRLGEEPLLEDIPWRVALAVPLAIYSSINLKYFVGGDVILHIYLSSYLSTVYLSVKSPSASGEYPIIYYGILREVYKKLYG